MAASAAEKLHTITSTRATCSLGCVWSLLRCKEKALPSFALLGVGASGFAVVHICGAVAAGMPVRAVRHVALGAENADTATASANAIAHRRAGRARHERARGRSVICGRRALLAPKL